MPRGDASRSIGPDSQPGQPLHKSLKTLGIFNALDRNLDKFGRLVAQRTNILIRRLIKNRALTDGGVDSIDDPDHPIRVLGLARVSKAHQATEGDSLVTQVEDIQALAEEKGYHLEKIFIEEGVSGQTLDREAIKKIRHYAKEYDIKYLIVYGISRIGRNSLEAIQFVIDLKLNYGVHVLTPELEVDPSKSWNMLQYVFEACSAENSTQYRSNASQRSKNKNWKDGNWSTAKRGVPPGYKYVKENDWLEIDKDTAAAVERAFKLFVRICEVRGPYKQVWREYGDELGISASDIRDMLTDPIYVGMPTYGGSENRAGAEISEEKRREVAMMSDPVKEVWKGITHPDPDLRIIDDDLYEEVQKAVEKVYDRNSRSDDVTQMKRDLVDEWGLPAVYHSADNLEFHCGRCGDPTVKDGVYQTSDGYTHRWKCVNADCGKVEGWPKEEHRFRMENHEYR
ncbi:recombinase family protein [Haloglomus salinum]|uniref:recombinase family protein n=1 Tax=Haloglomus salinum TaxID=2962673 RepID=UPI0025767C04|nr:recombinase family protein [Haloglomus salinum]